MAGSARRAPGGSLTALTHVAIQPQGYAPAARPTAAARWATGLLAVCTPLWLVALATDMRVTLSLLVAIGMLAAVIGLFRPVVGLFGIGLLCTLDGMARPLLLHGGLWRWNTLNYWLAGVLLLFMPLLVRRASAPMRALLLLLLWLGVGLLWSPDRANGIQQILGAVTTFGLVAYFQRAARVPDAWYWLAVVCETTAAAASVAFLLLESRLPYLNQNIWSHVPLMGVLAATLAFAAAPLTRRQQLILALLTAANAAAVFLSGSRGNLAIVLIALFALTLMTPSFSQNVIVSIATVLLGLGAISQFPALESRTIGRIAIMANTDETARRRTSGRFELALGGWYIFRAHPAGVGTGGFPVSYAALGHRAGLAGFKAGQEMSAHAGWVKVLAENGVAGIALLLLFVASFAMSGWRRRRWRPRVLGLMVTGALTVGLLSTEFQSKSLWFLCAGAMVLLAPPPAHRKVAA